VTDTGVAAAVVLVGRGRYQDPWHDDAATGHIVADLLATQGIGSVVRGVAPTALVDVDRPRLLVVIAGSGRIDPDWDGDDEAWRSFHRRLHSLVSREGVPLLALHQAANTFTDDATWAELIGGRWVPDASTHPPIGDAVFRPVEGEDHPVVRGLGPVTAFDERYCDLQPAPGSRILLTTELEGVEHPVVWQAPGPGRVLYDALGHDVRSYASASRRELLLREIRWLEASPGG
jgi:hypothetical protein